jgi:hypothetical protein
MAGGVRKSADDALALALASGSTVQAAAQQVGISDRTAYRRLEDPAFRARVDQARDEMLRQTIGRLSALGTEAVTALVTLMKSADSTDAIKLGAVRTALDNLFRGHEQFTLVRQIEDLRRLLEEVQGGHRDAQKGGGSTGEAAGGEPGPEEGKAASEPPGEPGGLPQRPNSLRNGGAGSPMVGETTGGGEGNP